MKQKKSKERLFFKELIICFLFVLFLASGVEAQNYCDFIKRVQAYQDSVKVDSREYFAEDSVYLPSRIDTSTFNIDTYMRMFNKLTIRPQFECSVYFDDFFLGGTPIIYVKEKEFDLKKYIEKKIIEKNIPNKDSVENNRRLFYENFLDNAQ